MEIINISESIENIEMCVNNKWKDEFVKPAYKLFYEGRKPKDGGKYVEICGFGNYSLNLMQYLKLQPVELACLPCTHKDVFLKMETCDFEQRCQERIYSSLERQVCNEFNQMLRSANYHFKDVTIHCYSKFIDDVLTENGGKIDSGISISPIKVIPVMDDFQGMYGCAAYVSLSLWLRFQGE
jgi:hypothetical protein